MTSSNLSNKEADCYCVCHSPFSSRASCEHCNGQYLRGLQDGEKQAKAAQQQLLTELLEGTKTPEEAGIRLQSEWVRLTKVSDLVKLKLDPNSSLYNPPNTPPKQADPGASNE